MSSTSSPLPWDAGGNTVLWDTRPTRTDSRVTFAPPVCAGSKTAKKMPTIFGRNDLAGGDGEDELKVSSDAPCPPQMSPKRCALLSTIYNDGPMTHSSCSESIALFEYSSGLLLSSTLTGVGGLDGTRPEVGSGEGLAVRSAGREDREGLES